MVLDADCYHMRFTTKETKEHVFPCRLEDMMRADTLYNLERQCWKAAEEYDQTSWLSKGLGKFIGQLLDCKVSPLSLYANLDPVLK